MALSRRERLLVVLGCAAIASAALWQFGWTPLKQRHVYATQQIATAQEMTNRLNRLQTLSAHAPTTPSEGGPLIGRVSRHAEANGLGLRQLVPTPDGLQITTTDIGFQDLLRWLGTVTRDEAVSIRTISLTRQPAPGIVSARFELGERP